ncbi:hypothetical protein Btru_039226 [Bulinus truncatus]|nr:hypothetical protein Btru_039226 [Bulinus truncatus]
MGTVDLFQAQRNVKISLDGQEVGGHLLTTEVGVVKFNEDQQTIKTTDRTYIDGYLNDDTKNDTNGDLNGDTTNDTNGDLNGDTTNDTNGDLNGDITNDTNGELNGDNKNDPEGDIKNDTNGGIKNDTNGELNGDTHEEKPDETESSGGLQKAPDGGYGWVIVFASFLHHAIIGGIGRSEGLFFIQYQERFGSGAQMTAWPMSLMTTLNFFLGPLCGAFISRYSVRTAQILASLLTSSGYILNGFAPNVYFLYFRTNRHRSLANGLSLSGVGFGTFALVPLVEFLFEHYGFTAAFMIIGALEMNGLVAAMFFRPLSTHLRFLKSDRIRRNRLTNGEEGQTLYGLQDLSAITDSYTSASSNVDEAAETFQNTSHTFQLPSCEDPESPHSKNSLADDASVIKIRNRKNCLQLSLMVCFPVEHQRNGENKKTKTFHWYLLRNFPFMLFCFSNTFFLMAFKTAFTFLPSLAISKGLSKPEAALVLTVSGATDTFGRVAIGLVMNIPAFKSLRPYVFNMILFFIAATSCVIPMLDSFYTYCVVSGIYGLATGAFISQKLVVLVDILGREVLGSALGISKLFQGVGSLTGPPFAGALRDSLGSFDSAFYLGGACMFASGLLLFLSNFYSGCSRNRKIRQCHDSRKRNGILSEILTFHS